VLDVGVFEDDASVLVVEVGDFGKGDGLGGGGGRLEELGGRGAGGDEERWNAVGDYLGGEIGAGGGVADYKDFLEEVSCRKCVLERG
jgi:hypothetical protein